MVWRAWLEATVIGGPIKDVVKGPDLVLHAAHHRLRSFRENLVLESRRCGGDGRPAPAVDLLETSSSGEGLLPILCVSNARSRTPPWPSRSTAMVPG